MQSFTDILKRVGNTPQISLSSPKDRVALYAKLEWFNPFGSLKDRAALWMIKDAENRKILKRDQTILLEPTSGNTGIALAGIAKALGYKVELIIPAKASEETKKLIRRLGATLLETDDDLCPRVGPGTDQCIALAEAMIKAHPEKYVMLNQYANESNFYAHYEGTGPEIWSNLRDVTHFIAGVGTGGTLTGVAAYLKKKNPQVKVIGVQPQRAHHIQGLRNLEDSAAPELLRRRIGLIDEWVKVSDSDAFNAVKTLAKTKALFVGPSSGAVYAAAQEVAGKLSEGKLVLMFADDGRKFWSLYDRFKVFTREEFDYYSHYAKYLPPNPLFYEEPITAYHP
ncbi:MAG: cysteine synthase family protein [Nitrososphaerales archaeon]